MNHRLMKYGSVFFLVMAACLLTSGCAKPPPQSGFLPDYSALRPDPQDESMRWWEKKGVDWTRYKKLQIDPVVVYFHPEAKNRQIEPDVLKELTDHFRTTVIEEMEGVYPVVDKPGPDVLRIRAAITDLVPANPVVNVITTVGVFIPLDMGGASMEAMFLDSTTNELLGAVVDARKGAPVDKDLLAGYTTWGHAKAAFRDWAVMLRESLAVEAGI
ncbi:MAG: DUF3313 domain-containing protein [Deltaproteobacteria bacterium]|nr:DUF3313 domain-containing protein [Deltaproteobacteria bacterium]